MIKTGYFSCELPGAMPFMQMSYDVRRDFRIDCDKAKDDGEGEQCPIAEDGVPPLASDFPAKLKIDFAAFADTNGDEHEDEDIDDEQD